jgi:hypothetical protein
MKRFTAVAVFIALIGIATGLAQYHPADLANVQRVYVDKLGNNDDAERFRSQLASELGRQGFTPSEQADGADAVIKGTFSFRDFGNKSGAAANLRVVNPDGKELWTISCNDPKPDRANESAQWVAHEVAKKMKDQKAKDIKRMR